MNLEYDLSSTCVLLSVWNWMCWHGIIALVNMCFLRMGPQKCWEAIPERDSFKSKQRWKCTEQNMKSLFNMEQTLSLSFLVTYCCSCASTHRSNKVQPKAGQKGTLGSVRLVSSFLQYQCYNTAAPSNWLPYLLDFDTLQQAHSDVGWELTFRPCDHVCCFPQYYHHCSWTS